jgi:hypothetical protein
MRAETDRLCAAADAAAVAAPRRPRQGLARTTTRKGRARATKSSRLKR